MKKIFRYIFVFLALIICSTVCTIFMLNHINIISINHDFFNGNKNVEAVSKIVNITETDTLSESIKKVYDSVVVVDVYNNSGIKIGSGSGFVYKMDDFGYIITNYHVIEDCDYVKIIMSSGDEVDGKILGGDSYSDIAVISISLSDVIKVAQIGSSKELSLGDTLFTVGSPLGSKYAGTVTKGILSGIDRKVTVKLTNGDFVMEVLQTDAAINPGNSGGPLLNINGEVIGVTSMKLVQDEIEGMGFAIPIELVMPIVKKLERGEKIERPLFGVTITDTVNKFLIKRYKIDVSDINTGVVILSVQDNTPASSSNFEVGDIITKINDEYIDDTANFNYILYKYSVGDKISVTYIRNGEEKMTDVLLFKKLGSD